MVSLFRLIFGLGLKIFAGQALGFLALKIVLVSLFTVTLPIIFKNFSYWTVNVGITLISDMFASSNLPSVVLEFSGLAGYLATHLRFIDCFTVMITGLLVTMSVRVILSLVS